jgi:hypothetical protein
MKKRNEIIHACKFVLRWPEISGLGVEKFIILQLGAGVEFLLSARHNRREPPIWLPCRAEKAFISGAGCHSRLWAGSAR